MNRTATVTKETERDYRAQIAAPGQGIRSNADLPLEEPGSSPDVVRIAARPGRTSDKAAVIGAAAEQLLRIELTGARAQGRDTAASELLEDTNPRVRRVAIGLVAR